MSIIGISGHATSGKDTVGKIIQILTNSPHFTDKTVVDFLNKPVLYSKWEIRKFADKLKDILCLLINCTREQLENTDFKEKELGEEWWYYKDMVLKEKTFPYAEVKQAFNNKLNYILVKPTPRILLQLIGTECFRNIIHVNTWVNALMSEYDSEKSWVVTDVRFPNEAKAIKDANGILIRINRIQYNNIAPHESETALDDYNHFDYVIDNNGSLENLIYQVRHILSKENFI